MKSTICMLLVAITISLAFSQTMFITQKDGKVDEYALHNIDKITFEITPTLPANPIASYSFNGNADDESGNGHNGTVYSAELTSDRFSNPNSAYLFHGGQEYIDIGNNIDAGPLFTISLWCYPQADAGNDKPNRYLFNHRADYRDILIEYGKRSGTDRRIMFMGFDENGGEGFYFYSNTILTLNTWYHILVSYDGETKRIYINGRLDNEAHWGKTVTWTENVFGNYIGRNAYDQPHENYNSFPGAIDDVRIYNRVLTNDEILSLFHENGWH